jgi:hypothetical protein
MKKAIGAGTSAALIASLLATAVAPSAFAAITVGSAGNVPVGGTSANNVSFTFTEQSIAAIPTNTAGSFTVTIAPASGPATNLSFVGTPSTAGSTGSLGASASIAGNVLTVNIAGSDTLNVESIFITGLKISAAAGTATGAITATLSAGTGSLAGAAAIFSGGGTATGTLAGGHGIGDTIFVVNVTSAGCNFTNTATSGNPLAFATSPESINITTAAPITVVPPVGQQTLTLAAGAASVHNAGEVVSETTGCASSTSLASPGTVVAALSYSSLDNYTVFPGESNQLGAPLTAVEPAAGFLPALSTLTYTITTPGVVFSTAPTVAGSARTAPVDTISANTLANPTVVTTTLAHGLQTGDTVTITGSNSTPTINGVRTVTVLSATTFSIPVNVTTAGSAGTVTPTTLVGGGAIGLSAAVISANRLSATVTVNTASVIPATITLSNILYDVASTVTPGTFISVTLSTSGALAVLPPSNTNAVVFRGVLAVSATTPTVYIGENNQSAGVVSFTESAAGFFTAGVGTGTNTFRICPSGVGYAFTLAPVAMVKNGVAAGNLILRDGTAASTTNIVAGTNLGNGCYGWTIWTASTAVSTIVIGAAPSAATGALINVNVDQSPGGVNVALSIGSSNFVNETLAATVQFANAMYRNQVAVSALSAPGILPGTTGPAGNVQIAETGLGQLKATETICFEILWQPGLAQDTFMNALDTADLPIATASGTGLVISPVSASSRGCAADTTTGTNPTIPANYMASFSFNVLQQSTAGDGKIVVSNLQDTVLTGSTLGPIQLSVFGTDVGVYGTQMDFHSTVSNAVIGTVSGIALVTQTSLGAVKVGTFTNATKVAAFGKYQTWRFAGGSALAGKVVQVWVATKNANGTWGAFTKLTTRLADSSGNAFFWWRYSTAKWISVRAMYPGDATHIASWGTARQGRWM